MSTHRTEFVDPGMPSTPPIIRAEPPRVTKCPDCGAAIGPTPAWDIVCPRRQQRRHA